MPRVGLSHQEVCLEIKRIARQQMAVHGAASLSLGAIARAMGMTAPALYRYYANRDALITALIYDAFVDLADATEVSVANLHDATPDERFEVIVRAYYGWALSHKQDYVLMYGAVFAGYQVPTEMMIPVWVRGMQPLLQAVGGLAAENRLIVPKAFSDVSIATMSSLVSGLAGEVNMTPDFLRLVTLCYGMWTQMHTAAWREVGPMLSTAKFQDGWFFELTLRLLKETYIKPAPH